MTAVYLNSKPPVNTVTAFYVAPTGSDSNAGSFLAPFKTLAKASSAMTASSTKTTYIRSGTYNTSTWSPQSNQSYIAYPGDPQWSSIINTTVGNLGSSNQSNITIKRLKFTSTATGSILQFGGCPALQILSCKAVCTGPLNFLTVYSPGGGLRIQGNNITADTWSSGGIFPINIIVNDGANYIDPAGYIINSNTTVGGTFAAQVQCQGTQGKWSNWHYDYNVNTGWGDNASTIGCEGVSWVGSNNPANSNNTCTGNTLTQKTGVTPFFTVGIEGSTAGCTYASNIINSQRGIALSTCPNSVFVNNNITVIGAAFLNSGSYTNTGIEIGTNFVNNVYAIGPNDPNQQCALSPLPSSTIGLSVNLPSAPYNSSWVSIPNNSTYVVGGVTWTALTPNTPHSLLYNSALGEYVYEVRNGENYQSVAYSDPAYVMRSENYGPTFPFNTNVTFAYDLIVYTGPNDPTTNCWAIFGQIHCDNNVVGGSPPISFDLQPDPGGPTGEKLRFDLNYQVGSNPVTYTNVGSMPFNRDRTYHIQSVFRDAQGLPTGYWQITVDGTVLVTYNGVTGYSTAVTQSYPKWGIYTGGNGASATTLPLAGQDFVAVYKNVTFG